MMIRYPSVRHSFCDKKIKDNDNICENYHQNLKEGFHMCPYGFSCVRQGDNIFCGFKINNHYSDKKINGHEKNSVKKTEMSIYTEEDFKKIFIDSDTLKELNELKERHEIYRSTIHDIKRAISSIRDVVHEIDFEKEEKTIIDGYDLISTRLDYHDKILMNEAATKIFGKIKPHKMIKKLKILLEYKAANRDISFDFLGSSNIEIYDDSKAIFILFFILMENAVKYAPIGSRIIVRFKDIDKYKTSVCIENQCTNITNDNLKHIFERGFRGDNLSSTSGNGIGLSIAKEIMDEYHINSNVKIDERLSKAWFVFYLELPSLDKRGNVYSLEATERF